MTEDLDFRPAVELVALVRGRQVSPVELIERLFTRIALVDAAIGAFCTLVHDHARLEAQRAESAIMRGETLGPLHGVPISIKDNLETAGLLTTYGSRLFARHIPSEDAVSVARLKAAGAIVIGKTNLPELASKSITDSPLFGDTRNPWAPDRVAGGSSGGAAAAVAAGLGPLAIGTDASGSIRIPAACCGVLGLKPTAGRVPQYPNENPWDITSQVGPLARVAADLDRARAYTAVEAVLSRHDFLVTPTLTAPPFKVGRAMPERIAGEPVASALEWHPFTFPFNLTGHPAISIPAGWTDDGLPVGVQVIGRRFADRELLAVARYIEHVQPWADRRPALPDSAQHEAPVGLASTRAEP